MAASVNKVILVGNLGGDPEVRYTNSGKAVASFTVATSSGYRGPSGDREPQTEWHRIVVWDKLADQCGQFLFKGRQVYLEGRLQTRAWEDRSGQKRYTTEVVAHQVVFLGSGRDRQQQAAQGGPSHPADTAGEHSSSSSQGYAAEPPPAENDDVPPSSCADDDEIPF